MARTDELSEDLRKRGVVDHQAGKGLEPISKEFGIHKSDKLWRRFKTTIGFQQRSLQEQDSYFPRGHKGTLG